VGPGSPSVHGKQRRLLDSHTVYRTWNRTPNLHYQHNQIPSQPNHIQINTSLKHNSQNIKPSSSQHRTNKFNSECLPHLHTHQDPNSHHLLSTKSTTLLLISLHTKDRCTVTPRSRWRQLPDLHEEGVQMPMGQVRTRRWTPQKAYRVWTAGTVVDHHRLIRLGNGTTFGIIAQAELEASMVVVAGGYFTDCRERLLT
jgi:hypothetical protein